MSTYPAERAPSAAGQSVNAGADNEITQDRFRGECFARVSIEPAVHLVPVGIGDAGNTAKGRAEASAVGWAWSS